MNRYKYWVTAIAASMLLGAQGAGAQDEEAARAAERAELDAAYEQALKAAEQEREQAMAAVEQARVEMQRAAEERVRAREAEAASARHRQDLELERTERERELSAMREELSRAHEELRQASREVARVHRKLEAPRGGLITKSGLINLGDRAVIGVVLGDSDETGVHLLGVSPDGPAERAGLEQGDVIVAIEGTSLVSETGDSPALVLHEVMETVEAGDEITITVDRNGDSLDYTVVAERREPFGWASMLRLPSIPEIPGAPVIVERIEIPEIDSAALAEQVERIREDLDRTRIVLEARRAEGWPHGGSDWEFEFENLSEIGEEAMLGANIWFGMPLTRGLKLAEIDASLGEYFKTDRGVLVLKARDDNDLQLMSGDVILDVGGTQVNKPSDVMRALRDLEPGSDLELNIMRDRKDRSIEIVVPEHTDRFGYSTDFDHDHEYYFHYETDKD